MTAPTPTPGQALNLLADWLEAREAHRDATQALPLDDLLVAQETMIQARAKVIELSPATLRQQAAQLAEAQAREARLREDLQRERLSHSNTIDQRDHAREAADRLAYALFDIDEIGEHSSANCPWANAAERLEALKNAVERLEALKGATNAE